MNTTSTQDNLATATDDLAAIELRLLTDFEISKVGGGENVAGFF